MVTRSKGSKQLSEAEIQRFLEASEALHLAIIKPFLSPFSDHYRQTRILHEVLLQTVREVTGKEVPFINWNTTGPSHPMPDKKF